MRFVFLFLMLFCLKGFSQAPQAINYQGILRNASGQAIPNKQVKIRVSVSTNLVVDNTSSVYTEEISAKTNEFGIYNVAIGKGKATKGTFNSISWGTNKYWVLIELDENLTNKFEFAGSMELASVPYALYAEKAKNVDNPVPGPVGPAGPQGLQGIKGDKGDTGAQGPIGLTGAAGATGAAGPQGLQGIKGDKGDTGAQGPIGLTGPAGAIGPQGPIGLTGLTGATGPAGAAGLQGLKGDKGDTGPAGPAGGPQGPIGLTGPQGIAGLNGKTILNGTLNPSNSIGTDGDFYINTSSNALFGPKSNGIWGNGLSLIGPQGLQGVPGVQGPAGPQGNQGVQGQTGAQGIQGTQGLAGIDGRTIISGTSNPTSSTGNNGDFYINTSTYYLFGPKTNGNWPSGISLVGPSGSDTQIRRGQTLNYINN